MASRRNEGYRKEIEILRILSEFDRPVGSTTIGKELFRRGFPLDERTVRYHLKILEEKGFVKGCGRNGRMITQAGLEELSRALAYHRLGFTITRYLSLAYMVTYDPMVGKGLVVANVAIIAKRLLGEMIEIARNLYRLGVLTAPYIKVLNEGERYQHISVPRGKVAILNVCNLTVDGLLIRSGVPIILRYGGLVQFINYKPIRFVELVAYEGTTLPPLELLTYRKATSITSFIKTGSGILPVNFREAPAEAWETVSGILDELKSRGWGGIIAVGQPNEPVLGVPVALDRFGISMVGGLIPGAALRELRSEVETLAPHILIPLEDMERID